MNTSQLKAMSTHAAKKDARLCLNGVRIHRKHIVATDGHRIACYPHTFDLPALDDDRGAYLIPHDILSQIDKKQPFTITKKGVLVCGHLTVPLELTQALDYLLLFEDYTLPSYDYDGVLEPVSAQYLVDAGKLAAQFLDGRAAARLKEGLVEARTVQSAAMAVVLTHSNLFIGVMPFRASKKPN